MSEHIIRQLSTLQPESGQRLPTSIIYGFSSSSGGSSQLIRIDHRGGDYVGIPAHGTASLLQHVRSRVKVFTLEQSRAGFMRALNQELKGGASYPVLTTVLGTAVGVASGGAGLLFTAATLAVDLNRRNTDVLARVGDEIWHVEEIGKVFEDNLISRDRYVPTHVSSFFLVDPYRSRGDSAVKGWLLHESRMEVALS